MMLMSVCYAATARVHVCVCVCVCVSLCVCARMYVCTYVRMRSRMSGCTCVSGKYEGKYACMYACMHVVFWFEMHVCMDFVHVMCALQAAYVMHVVPAVYYEVHIMNQRDAFYIMCCCMLSCHVISRDVCMCENACMMYVCV